MLEIGTQFGNSLAMWKEYLPNAEITGIDSIDNSMPVEGTTLIIGNAYDPVMLKRLFKYNVIIDDGSHSLADQRFVVINYSQLLTDSGILIIEDVASDVFIGKLREVVPEGFNSSAVDIRGEPDMILFLVWKKQS